MCADAPVRPEVILGVSGGIAAYKACELLRLFTESGHAVTVIPTEAALRFVGEPTWAALSGRPVATGVFDDAHDVPHVQLGRKAELVVVAPATADVMARAVSGRADDLLTATLLTARCPVLFAPAMHTEMWEHPATVDNVATLRRRGAIVAEPASGRLTGADTGKGRLPDPAEIFAFARHLLAGASVGENLRGRHILVTAGGTREAIDPVRYLANRSSGKQGFALARAAAARGAKVTIVAANVSLPVPLGAEVITVESAAQLRSATVEAAAGADAVIMAAAPADFRPASYSDAKIKKDAETTTWSLDLETTVDIAAELGRAKRPGQVLVTFAAETHDAVAHAKAKLAAKNADLMVLNDVSGGKAFGRDDNAVTLLWPDGTSREVALSSKDAIAGAVVDAVAAELRPL
ncbi:bifunctional phosphopantothenoylcysteine decarboxylase/phosphopantothenate--cysteine ligase CoaBC [Stackebrandtia nassauensis]|uniref:Coenzyme A biosynthesis bifunctional protein CoaBC n=1 Tax=Stackebrandtia nassauensis (strain DSM 44728 / CIP 108903 / NRRL B-16338 / NBRC 102104 / LLR-40K-21) TaxID=446470 RepID=D3QBE8_STANL|nr:bifunctional phosphopantothenoylcysteine decarboxylase/phosphopantothenate--cysteine ligase CoaBC [Stackebrandtia nassauensis]ADD42830.1 phosphopantothenoylcysteine decarboxylase/phosphopantothenate/cysteine ligase [Stackebrandtia nassauensis DSM 44728]